MFGFRRWEVLGKLAIYSPSASTASKHRSATSRPARSLLAALVPPRARPRQRLPSGTDTQAHARMHFVMSMLCRTHVALMVRS